MIKLPALAVITVALTAAQAPEQPLPKKEVAEKSADNRDKMVCKRFLETGSLVRGYRSCKTKWEWERERDAINSNRTLGGCNDPESPACRPG